MNLQNLAWKKGRDTAGHKLCSWTTRQPQSIDCGLDCRNFTTSAPAGAAEDDASSDNKHVPRPWERRRAENQQDRFANRDFFLSVLGSTATKREARSYLKAFTPPKEASSKLAKSLPKSGDNGVNLGNFYGSIRSVEESPKFVQKPVPEQTPTGADPPLHLALVKVRNPQVLTDETLLGIGRTLTQLSKLGLHSIVVVDCNDSSESPIFDQPDWKSFVGDQGDRIVAAIEANDGGGARKVDNVIGVSDQIQASFASPLVRGNTHVTYRRLLMTPLRRTLIPVIPSMGYTDNTMTGKSLDANDVVMALAREFSGLHVDPLPDEDHVAVATRIKQLRKEVSLDRLIILDPLGGIPASHRPDGVHVFLNMEQEYAYVKKELMGGESYYTSKNLLGNTLSGENKAHLRNLELMKATLALLPPTSSALLTTPDEAANSARRSTAPSKTFGVGTRRLRNPLIHNLLTDKPAFSSSLPVSRLGQLPQQQQDPTTSNNKPQVAATTFAKRGIPLTMFPNPLKTPWQPPLNGKPQITLQDPQIDLSRLVHLIEDSFDRKLDVEDYLKRVNNKIAGVIIAGEYEGGAILTWETPPGVPDDGGEESRARMVPYLDKFAVLKRSQGSGGVADVVFKAMVRDCFPNGVCWRSRQNNPVNKWYFERSRGTWKLPGTNWTMFWTTPDLSLDRQEFLDYKGVCDNIEPSWADKKAVVD